jgi:hypothetical protein
MPLDLERFWAVVRPKRRKPRPVAPRKSRRPIEIWVEAVDDSYGDPCTPRIKVPLSKDTTTDGYKGELRFPAFSVEVNVSGFRIYASRRSESVFVSCDPRRLFPGGILTMTLYISDGPVLDQLKQRGLGSPGVLT